MALQLSGSIDVIGGFNTTQGGTYSGSGFYEDIFLSGSVYDGSFKLGDPETILTIDQLGKAKWEQKQNISDLSNDPAVKQRDFDYYINWEGGLDFSASAASIPIVGDSYYIEETVINLSSADATFARFDIIVATTGSNNTGSFEVVEGTPAQSPFYPAYDENKSIALKYILVRAAATDAAAGGDGTADNNDGSNNTGGDDGDDGDGSGGDPYRGFENRVLWNGTYLDSNPNQQVNWMLQTARGSVRRFSPVGVEPSIIKNGTAPYVPLESEAVIKVSIYGWRPHSYVRAAHIVTDQYDHTKEDGLFNFSDLNNLSFFIKPTIPFPVGFAPFMLIYLVTRSGVYGKNLGHYFATTSKLVEKKVNFQDTSYQKVTLSAEDFGKYDRFSKTGEDIVAVEMFIGATNNTAAATIRGNSNYNLVIDKIVAQLGSGTPTVIPTAKASSTLLPAFTSTYGSPTIKNLKVNSKGTKLIGNYSNILGGSNNILTGSLTVTSSIFSSTTGSFEIVDGPEYSSIVGGYKNFISGSITGSAILGGFNNKITSNFSTVIGGQNNTSSFDNTFIIGCNLTADKVAYTFVNNIDIQGTASASIFSGSYVGDGSGLTGIAGGDFSPFITSSNDGRSIQPFTGSHCTIMGCFTTIAGGLYNTGSGDKGFIGAGIRNYIDSNGGDQSFIGAGDTNTISNSDSAIVSGYANSITGQKSFIGAGTNHTLSGISGIVGSGFSNDVEGDYSSILGGCRNCIVADRSAIGGGADNTINVSANSSSIAGGFNNSTNFANTHILGSGITADKSNFTFVNNLDVEGTVSASIFSGSFVGDGTGLTGVTASPAGTDTQVQYNNSGVLGASSNFTYDGTTLNLEYTGTGDLLRLTSTDGGAASAPDLTFCRNSASPADQDTLGVIQFFGQSDFPACKNYASIFSRIGCATAGQTRGNLLFKADRCNAFINTLTISPEGLYVLPPSDTAETGAGIGLTVTGDISGSNVVLNRHTTTPTNLQTGSIFHSGSAGAGCLYFSPDGSSICQVAFV